MANSPASKYLLLLTILLFLVFISFNLMGNIF
jgi:hypothetical protein